MRYILLGTGAPRVSLERAGTAHLAIVGEDGLLFDCGPGVTRRLCQAGIPLQAIGYLFFTHHHYDHLADYGHFTLARWDHARGPTPLQVCGPPGTEHITRLLFGPEGVYHGDIIARTQHPMSQQVFVMRGGKLPRPGPEVRARDVGPGLVWEGPAWRVLAGPAWHAQPHLACYSYRLETAERTIVYSGDTGLCAELAEFARGADTLIHMCSLGDDVLERHHLAAWTSGPTLAGRVAAAAGVRKLVLTHAQPHEMGTSSGMADAVARAAGAFGGEIVFGTDLLEV